MKRSILETRLRESMDPREGWDRFEYWGGPEAKVVIEPLDWDVDYVPDDGPHIPFRRVVWWTNERDICVIYDSFFDPGTYWNLDENLASDVLVKPIIYGETALHQEFIIAMETGLQVDEDGNVADEGGSAISAAEYFSRFPEKIMPSFLDETSPTNIANDSDLPDLGSEYRTFRSNSFETVAIYIAKPDDVRDSDLLAPSDSDYPAAVDLVTVSIDSEGNFHIQGPYDSVLPDESLSTAYEEAQMMSDAYGFEPTATSLPLTSRSITELTSAYRGCGADPRTAHNLMVAVGKVISDLHIEKRTSQIGRGYDV